MVWAHGGTLLPVDVEEDPVFVTGAVAVMNAFRAFAQSLACVPMVCDREKLAVVHLQRRTSPAT